MNYYIKEGKLYQGTIYNMILQNDYITIHGLLDMCVCVCVCARIKLLLIKYEWVLNKQININCVLS